MKKTGNIHNLDALEKEIYRLKLEAKNIGDHLDSNIDHLQKNFYSIAANSFNCHSKPKQEKANGFWQAFFNNESFKSSMSNISASIAGRAAEKLNEVLEDLLSKKR